MGMALLELNRSSGLALAFPMAKEIGVENAATACSFASCAPFGWIAGAGERLAYLNGPIFLDSTGPRGAILLPLIVFLPPSILGSVRTLLNFSSVEC